jgi:hypothetical protein
MKLSELIKAAQELQEKIGDKEVLSDDLYLIVDIEKIQFNRSIEGSDIKKNDIFAIITNKRNKWYN